MTLNVRGIGVDRIRGIMYYMMSMVILARGEATHPQAQFWVVSQKHLVKVRPHFGSSGDSCESPAIQLAGKTREFGGLEILDQDLGRKLLLLVNNERSAMRQPRYCIGIIIIRQDFH